MGTLEDANIASITFDGAVRAVEGGRITKTHLGYHMGIMSSLLTLDFRGLSQSIGGYNLTRTDQLDKTVRAIMNVTDAASWEEVNGRPVRAVHRGDLWSPIIALLHITDGARVYHPDAIVASAA